MLASLIPPFDFEKVMITPWRESGEILIWVVVMGAFVSLACAWIGVFLVLRKLALVGDAISHSVLPGIAVAYLMTRGRDPGWILLGATAAGVATTLLIELITSRSRVKQDAAIGITFTTLFAIGVLLITLFAGQIDLDTDCVLHGEILLVGTEPSVLLPVFGQVPQPVAIMGLIALGCLAVIGLFYKELLVSSFDPGLARLLGIRPSVVHYGLMVLLSVVVVCAFRAVGAILVIAMLVLPASTGMLLAARLPAIFAIATVHALASTILGLHLSLWLNCSTAPAMVVVGFCLFLAAWIAGPRYGLISKLLRRRLSSPTGPEAFEGRTEMVDQVTGRE